MDLKRGIVLISAVIVVGGLAWIAVETLDITDSTEQGDDRVGKVAVSRPANRMDVPDLDMGGSRPLAAKPALETPLPDVDAPLLLVVEELEARAQRGDRKAACRLANDASLCSGFVPNHDAVRSLMDQYAAQEQVSEAQIRLIEQAEILARRSSVVCADLPQGWAEDRAWRYMVRAAELGDADMALRFVLQPPLDRRFFLEQREAWDTYATMAPRLLKDLARRGDPRAVFHLQRAHAGRSPLIGMPSVIQVGSLDAAIYALALYPMASPDLQQEYDAEIKAYRRYYSESEWRDVVARSQEIPLKPGMALPLSNRGNQLAEQTYDSTSCGQDESSAESGAR